MTQEETMQFLQERLSAFERVNSPEALKLARWALYQTGYPALQEPYLFKVLHLCEQVIAENPDKTFDDRLDRAKSCVNFVVANPDWLPGQ